MKLLSLAPLFAVARCFSPQKDTQQSLSMPIAETAGGWDFHVTSDKYPGHQLRAKAPNPSKLNLDTVKQYSGYLDIEEDDKHFFFWFFESRNDPQNDPVLLWINGGPGCSSFTGLLFELGPSLMNVKGKIEYNPYSWNSNASVIFLDQPVNVGFSYSNKEKVSNSYAAAKDVYVFLELFFQQFEQYRGLKFHISGESYAGVYLPLIADEILSHDDRIFDLESVLIGNGITAPKIQYDYYQPMLCGLGGYKQVIPDERCESMTAEQEKCDKLVDLCFKSNYSPFACLPAMNYCEKSVSSAVSDYNINPYDIRMVCDNGPCYPETDHIDAWLNQPEIQAALGAEVSKFESCNNEVFLRFFLSSDQMRAYEEVVAKLLDKHDLPVLLYAGDKDYICNWLGNKAWSDLLDYKHHDQFAAAETKKFISDEGVYSGDVKNYDKFTFIRLFDAGHMVPHDQPESSWSMVNRWLSGDYALA